MQAVSVANGGHNFANPDEKNPALQGIKLLAPTAKLVDVATQEVVWDKEHNSMDVRPPPSPPRAIESNPLLIH